MPKIRIETEAAIKHGQTLIFKAPVDYSNQDGLIVSYPDGTAESSTEFSFVNSIGQESNGVELFLSGELVSALLDIEQKKAYIQNINIEAYLDGFLSGVIPISQKGKPDGVATLDENGRVNGLQACSPIKHIYDAELMTYTLSADDIGKPLVFHIADAATSNCTVVIPADSDMSIFPEGTAIEISKWNSGLTLTIECEDGVSMRSRDTNALSSVVIDGKYGAIALLRIGAVRWQVRGDYA